MIVIHYDLETGSLSQDAAVFSIGAVALDDFGNEIAHFHERINPYCADNLVRRFDNIGWWQTANEPEWNEIQRSKQTLKDALIKFTDFVETLRAKDTLMFFQKRMMDSLWLENVYSGVLSVTSPVYYKEVYELSTYLMALGGIEYCSTNAHNALSDARAQAQSWIDATCPPHVSVTYLFKGKEILPNLDTEEATSAKVLLNGVDHSHVVETIADIEYLDSPNLGPMVLYANYHGVSLSEAAETFDTDFVPHPWRIGPFTFKES